MSNPRLSPNPASSSELVQAWREEPGLVFFDSATGQGRSLVARRPGRILRGKLAEDWPALEAVLAERSGARRLEEGFLAGAVAYDGTFEFGLYDEVAVYEGAGERAAEWRAAGPPVQFRPLMQREDYVAMVERAQRYIAAGDIYQVNLSYPYEAEWQGDPLAFHAALRVASPAPRACFLRLSTSAICSASPELFLKMQDRVIETRPIKGTRPRASEAKQDRALSRELQSSAKEAAELTMITDLERSDLGQVCEFGSVQVPGLLELERYRQVFHLVSTVRGTLRREVSHVAALRACFPGGSITGAPKIRAMEIIAELEPFERGFYTGALGYFGFNGESRFGIAIRTAVATGDALRFHVGAGIVADSVPELEYEETQHKAAGLLAAAERMNEGGP